MSGYGLSEYPPDYQTNPYCIEVSSLENGLPLERPARLLSCCSHPPTPSACRSRSMRARAGRHARYDGHRACLSTLNAC